MSVTTTISVLSLLFIVFVVIKGVMIIRQSECMIIERLGKYRGVLTSGLNIIVPFLDKPREFNWVKGGYLSVNDRIDLRETVLDIPEQAVITKDNVSIHIDALLYLQITSPQHAIYEISNLPIAVTQLAQTSLRNVIGEMDLDETLISRDVINSKLKAILDDATDKWGTKVNRVELKNITPPDEIQNAMEKQMQAERERRAKVLDAEGDKQSRIARSEGQRQEQVNLADADKRAQILKAEGESAAIRFVANAKKEAIDQISSAFNDDKDLASKFIIASNYLDAFNNFSHKEGDKVYIPYEASSVLSGMASIKDILSQGQGK